MKVSELSASFVQISLLATMSYTSAPNSWYVFTVFLTYIPLH